MISAVELIDDEERRRAAAEILRQGGLLVVASDVFESACGCMTRVNDCTCVSADLVRICHNRYLPPKTVYVVKSEWASPAGLP